MNYRARIAFVTSVALILLIAGLVTGQPSAAGDRAEIRGTGTFTTAFSSNIGDQTVGTLQILSRYAVTSSTGSLVGTTVTLQPIARADVVEQHPVPRKTGAFLRT